MGHPVGHGVGVSLCQVSGGGLSPSVTHKNHSVPQKEKHGKANEREEGKDAKDKG